MAKAKADAPMTSIWKPLGEEFFLEGDFSVIAEALGIEISAVAWTITDEAKEGVDGHTLSGVAA